MTETGNDRVELHIGRASDLSGSDRLLYRLFEILPGFLSLGTLALLVVLSFITPSIVAYFTIGFSAFWLSKTIFLTIHLRHSFKRLKHNIKLDWFKRLENMKYGDVYHLVIFPFYKEPYEVIKESVDAIQHSSFPGKQIGVVLATEERAGEEAQRIARRVQNEYKDVFLDVVVTTHPKDTPGEIAGKGSNIAYAAKIGAERVIKDRGIAAEDTLVSAFDVDTVVYPDYFSCLTWHFLTDENPLKKSFQPIPLYNNNIWNAPILSRVLAYSSTFWQMIQQERPERLSTFSSHTIPLSALKEVGYWQRNMVNEDSRIYWNLFVHNNGNYDVVPISYPVSMDANVGVGFWGTVVNLYKQHLRWSYGAENIPYLLYHFIKNKKISFIKKMRVMFVHIEGFWSLAVQPIILFAVGWLPLLVGGNAFNETVLSYNVPIVSSWFLTAAMVGLIFLAAYSIQLVPKYPNGTSFVTRAGMLLQWVLVPVTMLIFSSIPGLDAQIRLMFGKYLGFWVTPKNRGGKEGHASLPNVRTEQASLALKQRGEKKVLV